MAFWKSHADPVSWWSHRRRLLRINTTGPCSEGRRCWNQSVSCALCCVRAGSSRPCERMIFTEASTAGKALIDFFPSSFLWSCFCWLNLWVGRFQCMLPGLIPVSHTLSCVRTGAGIFRFLGLLITLLSYLCKIFCSSTEKMLSLVRSS